MAKLRNAAGLAFFSVMILLEGNFRTATMVAVYAQNISVAFSAAALLAGGVCQIVMGFAGLFLAAAFVFGLNVSKPVVTVVLVLEGECLSL